MESGDKQHAWRRFSAIALSGALAIGIAMVLLAGAVRSSPSGAAGPDGDHAVIVNGAEHPEQIPDSVAYRLVFLTMAEPEEPTDAQRARQRAYLEKAGLGEQDRISAVIVLANFKTRYDQLDAQYNESVLAANRTKEPPGLETFLSQQDELVQETRDALKADLRPEAMDRFDAYVRREKRNMQMSVPVEEDQ
ncbi:MAG: hypothetical protein ACRD3T_09995 [Terriglobia bacterium]